MVRLLLHLMFVRNVPLPCADGQTFWFVFLCMSRLSCCHLCRFVVVRICACCSRWSRRLSLCVEFGHSVRCLCIVNLGRVLHVRRLAIHKLVQLWCNCLAMFQDCSGDGGSHVHLFQFAACLLIGSCSLPQTAVKHLQCMLEHVVWHTHGSRTIGEA